MPEEISPRGPIQGVGRLSYRREEIHPLAEVIVAKSDNLWRFAELAISTLGSKVKVSNQKKIKISTLGDINHSIKIGRLKLSHIVNLITLAACYKSKEIFEYLIVHRVPYGFSQAHLIQSVWRVCQLKDKTYLKRLLQIEGLKKAFIREYGFNPEVEQPCI